MRIFARIWLTGIYLLLYLPIILVIVYSFNAAKYSTDWRGFTLKWYNLLLQNETLLDSAINSLIIGSLSASLATVLGVLAAVALKRYRFLGRKVFHGSVFVLTVSPDIVMGISLLIFFIVLQVELGFTTLLIAHTTLSLPFVIITILARLSEFDESIVEAARDLGATEWQAFYYIILPLILPAVIAGWLLAFTLSMDDVLISFFVTGPSFEVLPLKIYSMVRLGMKPDVNALSALMFGITVIMVLLAWTIGRWRKN